MVAETDCGKERILLPRADAEDGRATPRQPVAAEHARPGSALHQWALASAGTTYMVISQGFWPFEQYLVIARIRLGHALEPLAIARRGV